MLLRVTTDSRPPAQHLVKGQLCQTTGQQARPRHPENSKRVAILFQVPRDPLLTIPWDKRQCLQPWLGAFQYFLPLFRILMAISDIFDIFDRCDIQQYKVGGGQNKCVSKKTFFFDLPGVSGVTLCPISNCTLQTLYFWSRVNTNELFMIVYIMPTFPVFTG